MKKCMMIVSVLLLGATPALAAKVYIDYAAGYDFGGVETFQYVETLETNADSLMDARIVDNLRRQLVEGGLVEVDENPDIYVTYHVTTRDQQVFETTGYGYGGVRRGWRRWGTGVTATTTERTYTEGTLIVDAYDAKDKQMVWRGTATLTVKDNPEKRAKQIAKILDKMGKRWRKILEEEGQ
jgi:hypothetical protein